MIIEPLSPNHPVGAFVCSSDAITAWFQDRALFNHQHGYTRTFVGLSPEGEILGYYSLCAASLERRLFGRREQGAPASIPLLLLARWAVDSRYENIGHGRILLEDALERCLRLSAETGVRAIIVNPVDAKAKAIYAHYGFRALIEGTMFLPIDMLKV